MFTLENFYQSKTWCKFVSRLKLERINDQGELLCEHCGKPINKKYDCIGHHKIELTEDNVNDFTISLNPENVELIHFKCHNKIHKRYDGFRQSVYLIYGSPCAGKSTWVEENATENDLILDVDRIWESISKCDKFNKNNRLRPNVFGIRDIILDQIRMRKGKWINAYVIGGYPLRTDRERLCELLNATPVFIDTPKEECLSRAKNDEWKSFIEEWFENFVE